MIPSSRASNSESAPGRRIVIATIGSLGDLHPYIGLALGLRARGHRPVIAAPSMHRAHVQAAGLEFAPLGPEAPATTRELYARILDPKKGLEFVFRELFMPAARSTYADLAAAVAADGGAALLISTPAVFAAPIFAEKSGTPWVSTVLAPIAFFSAYEPPVLPALPSALTRGPRWLCPWWGRIVRAVARRITRAWAAPLDEMRRELGLPPAAANPLYEGQHSPRMVLAMFSPLLGAPQRDWPAQTRQTGFVFYDGESALDPALARFLDEGPPPVVFTLGSTAVNAAGDFYKVSVEAAAQSGMRALLLVGKEPENRVGLPDPRPETVAVFDYAPYSAVFPRAAAIVHQGGVGTTAQALRAGRPMIVVPFNFDQPDNAVRVARLGAARVIPPARYKAAVVAAALREMLSDDTTQQSAKAAADHIKMENGVDAACDVLKGFL